MARKKAVDKKSTKKAKKVEKVVEEAPKVVEKPKKVVAKKAPTTAYHGCKTFGCTGVPVEKGLCARCLRKL